MVFSLSRRLIKPSTLRSFQAVICSRNYAEEAGTVNLSLTFGTPTRSYFHNENVSQVDVPSGSGNFSILPLHVPIIAVLRPGLMTIMKDGNTEKFFVSSGSITVNADSSAQILAEEAAPLEQFDIDSALQNAESARLSLATATDEVEKAMMQIQIDACEALVAALEGK